MNVLKINEKQSLNKFLGGDSRSFDELFRASSDTCDPAVFHAQCDNKGPTVTIVYTKSGDVFGGYTSVSWIGGENQHFYDDKAFLFVLSKNDGSGAVKIPITNPERALLHNEDSGPTFGSGPDLAVFSGVIAKDATTATFPLNCRITAKDYSRLPASLETLVSQDYTATDVVVYSVKEIPSLQLEIPWTPEPVFLESYLEELLTEVTTYWPLKTMGVSEGSLDYVNILLLGPISAGKSSFYNTVNSVFCNRVTTSAAAGSRDQSVTMRYSMYTFRSPKDFRKVLKFRLCDCRGVEASSFDVVRDIDAIVDGHVPHDFDLGTNSAITPRTPGYRNSPKLCDKIHCVAFVLDASNTKLEATFLSNKDRDQMKEVMCKLDQRGITQRILLNKVDKACSLTAENPSLVCNSALVRDRCTAAADCLGLPPLAVLPMKNNYQERVVSLEVKILALYNLRNLLWAADDYFFANHLSELQDDKIPPAVAKFYDRIEKHGVRTDQIQRLHSYLSNVWLLNFDRQILFLGALVFLILCYLIL